MDGCDLVVWGSDVSGRSRVLVVALAVFALAVGLLVGSGLLSLGLFDGSAKADELARAHADAEAAQAEAQQGRDFADAAGPSAVRARLQGHSVALVRTSDTTDADLAAASARIEATGATITATVALTDEWTADDRGPFRDALAEQITESLPNPPEGSTTAQVLSAALANSLAAGGEFDAAGQESADTLWSLLVEADLVTGERSGVADMFLLVARGGDVSSLTDAFAASSLGTVVGFTGSEAGDATRATTVTNAATFYGAWAVAGAAIQAANGISGAYDATDADELIAQTGNAS
jgi:hypothetical protein